VGRFGERHHELLLARMTDHRGVVLAGMPRPLPQAAGYATLAPSTRSRRPRQAWRTTYRTMTRQRKSHLVAGIRLELGELSHLFLRRAFLQRDARQTSETEQLR